MIDQLSASVAAKLSEPYVLLPLISTSALNFIQSDPTPVTNIPSEIDNTLWVDRYRPRRFVDLMGNERVARETMGWVKQWDWCVFGKRRGKKRPRETNENWDGDEDEYHRPREKVS
jgi:chromosome transmission fidelity protein 18